MENKIERIIYYIENKIDKFDSSNNPKNRYKISSLQEVLDFIEELKLEETKKRWLDRLVRHFNNDENHPSLLKKKFKDFVNPTKETFFLIRKVLDKYDDWIMGGCHFDPSIVGDNKIFKDEETGKEYNLVGHQPNILLLLACASDCMSNNCYEDWNKEYKERFCKNEK